MDIDTSTTANTMNIDSLLNQSDHRPIAVTIMGKTEIKEITNTTRIYAKNQEMYDTYAEELEKQTQIIASAPNLENMIEELHYRIHLAASGRLKLISNKPRTAKMPFYNEELMDAYNAIANLKKYLNKGTTNSR